MPALGVNIDHVATLREARKGVEPEPVYAAYLVQAAGADSVVVHLREDRRHIKDRDLALLKEVVTVKLNLEMSVSAEILAIACKVKPDQATLVPERRRELTTEGGLDVIGGFKRIKEAVAALRRSSIEVSLFIDPSKDQIEAAVKTGARMVELHTGAYAEAGDPRRAAHCLQELRSAAGYAAKKGLKVFAGHGLNYQNVSAVAAISRIEELNIGHSIISRAVLVGLERAVREMKALIA